MLNLILLKERREGMKTFFSVMMRRRKTMLTLNLKELEIISILDEKIKGKDKKFIENIVQKFLTHFGNGNIVKVRLTEEGESL